MKEIKEKIAILLDYSNEDPNADTGGWEGLRNKIKEQDRMMDELKELARENDTLLGRIMKFQMADSYAVYVITNVLKRSVVLTWIDYCDGWQDDRLGVEGTVTLEYATKKVQGEDKLEALFAKK